MPTALSVFLVVCFLPIHFVTGFVLEVAGWRVTCNGKWGVLLMLAQAGKNLGSHKSIFNASHPSFALFAGNTLLQLRSNQHFPAISPTKNFPPNSGQSIPIFCAHQQKVLSLLRNNILFQKVFHIILDSTFSHNQTSFDLFSSYATRSLRGKFQ